MAFVPRKVLLTGGAGFIGSHVAEAFLRDGAMLMILDCLDEFYSPAWKRGNLEAVRRAGKFEFAEIDICDSARLHDLFRSFRPDTVIHLAARAGVRPSIEQPLLYERVNVSGTVNVLECAREYVAEKIIFGSSSSVYGGSSRAPFSENEINLRPISPYAATKVAAEMLCYTYAHLTHIPIVCLRFFTVYGPRQRPDLAIHKFTALIEAGKPVPIFGDGTTGRDYTYIDDIVAGVVAASRYAPTEIEGAFFDVFNLGNSHPVRLNDMVVALERATGRTAIRSPQPMQPGDVPLTWADISKSEKLLGYHPATPLEEGLKKFVEWYRAADPKQRA
ncbi:MAG: GDP-mannose 4,6-dehydratase [Candidatus Acidiferrales bacterium]